MSESEQHPGSLSVSLTTSWLLLSDYRVFLLLQQPDGTFGFVSCAVHLGESSVGGVGGGGVMATVGQNLVQDCMSRDTSVISGHFSCGTCQHIQNEAVGFVQVV